MLPFLLHQHDTFMLHVTHPFIVSIQKQSSKMWPFTMKTETDEA